MRIAPFSATTLFCGLCASISAGQQLPVKEQPTGTTFASIPSEDTLHGTVSETRLSAQSSRISLRVDAEFPEPETRFRRLSGYFEMDFGGTTPGTVAVTSTSVGFRLRQAFAEVQYGRTFSFAFGTARPSRVSLGGRREQVACLPISD